MKYNEIKKFSDNSKEAKDCMSSHNKSMKSCSVNNVLFSFSRQLSTQKQKEHMHFGFITMAKCFCAWKSVNLPLEVPSFHTGIGITCLLTQSKTSCPHVHAQGIILQTLMSTKWNIHIVIKYLMIRVHIRDVHWVPLRWKSVFGFHIKAQRGVRGASSPLLS